MNLFSDTILRNTIQYMSNPILVNPNSENEYTINGFMTNATLSPNSSYHLHSSNEFKRGDYLMMTDDNYYMVTGDVIQERGSKYKATLDFCNYKNAITEKVTSNVIVGYQPNGRPIYGTENKVVGLFVGVIRHREVMITSSAGITVANTEVILTLQDNQITREKYVVNFTFNHEGINWMVREVIKTKQGLLELRLMSTQS